MSFHHFLDSVFFFSFGSLHFCLFWILLFLKKSAITFTVDLNIMSFPFPGCFYSKIFCCFFLAVWCTQMWSLLNLYSLGFTGLLKYLSWYLSIILGHFQALLFQTFLLPHFPPFLSFWTSNYRYIRLMLFQRSETSAILSVLRFDKLSWLSSSCLSSAVSTWLLSSSSDCISDTVCFISDFHFSLPELFDF